MVFWCPSYICGVAVFSTLKVGSSAFVECCYCKKPEHQIRVLKACSETAYGSFATTPQFQNNPRPIAYVIAAADSNNPIVFAIFTQSNMTLSMQIFKPV